MHLHLHTQTHTHTKKERLLYNVTDIYAVFHNLWPWPSNNSRNFDVLSLLCSFTVSYWGGVGESKPYCLIHVSNHLAKTIGRTTEAQGCHCAVTVLAASWIIYATEHRFMCGLLPDVVPASSNAAHAHQQMHTSVSAWAIRPVQCGVTTSLWSIITIPYSPQIGWSDIAEIYSMSAAQCHNLQPCSTSL